MPISRHARWMRSAISPRFAIRIFSNIAKALPPLLDHEEGLAILHGLAVLDQDCPDGSGNVGFDFIQELHRLDDAQRLPLGHYLPDVDERRRPRRGRTIER